MNLIADQQLIRDAEAKAGGANIHWVRNRTLSYDAAAAFFNKGGIKEDQYKEIFIRNEEALKKFVATGLRDDFPEK